MADLIDRDKLLEDAQFRATVSGPRFTTKQVGQAILDVSNYIINIIKKEPTVDTERHAHWIENKDITELTLTCNCCGYSYIEADPNCEERYDFCPNCGCKMDEVEDETQNN